MKKVRGWCDLTMGQYDSIVHIMNDDKLDDVDKDIAIYGVVYGLGADEVRSLSVSTVMGMVSELSFLGRSVDYKEPVDFRYGGYKFRVGSITDISYGQYIDIESARDMVSLLGCILVPDGHRYGDGYDIDFSGMGVELGMSIVHFFVVGLARCIKPIRGSLLSVIRYHL